MASDVTNQLVLSAADVGNIHVVGRRREIFVLLASEDISGDKMNLGVTVFAGLGCRHVDNLAGATFDDNVAVLAQSRTLHGEGKRRAGVGGLEGNIVLHRKASMLIRCILDVILFRGWLLVRL